MILKALRAHFYRYRRSIKTSHQYHQGDGPLHAMTQRVTPSLALMMLKIA